MNEKKIVEKIPDNEEITFTGKEFKEFLQELMKDAEKDLPKIFRPHFEKFEKAVRKDERQKTKTECEKYKPYCIKHNRNMIYCEDCFTDLTARIEKEIKKKKKAIEQFFNNKEFVRALNRDIDVLYYVFSEIKKVKKK